MFTYVLEIDGREYQIDADSDAQANRLARRRAGRRPYRLLTAAQVLASRARRASF